MYNSNYCLSLLIAGLCCFVLACDPSGEESASETASIEESLTASSASAQKTKYKKWKKLKAKKLRKKIALKRPCSKKIKCPKGTVPTDTNGDGCPDTCVCEVQILCAPGYVPVDTTGNGCDDSCELEPCAMVACAEGYFAVDTDGDGCEDECELEPCAMVACAPGYVAYDSNGNGCEDACAASCGTIVGIPCPKGSFCQYPAGSCNSADMGGKCVEVPEVCTDEFNPQCGCDGETYGNPCELLAAGVNLDHEGECGGPCITVACAPGYTAYDSNGDGCDDECQCPLILCTPGTAPYDSQGYGCQDTCVSMCGTIAGLTCDDSDTCVMPEGTCNSADMGGICLPTPTVCTKEYNPQCGCDGETYGNPCELLASGANLAYAGECCETQDVAASGTCEMVLGVFYTSNGCETLSGCSCKGSDCSHPFESIGACQAQYAQCGGSCDAQDAKGEGNCDMFFGFAFDGNSCVPVSGCNCIGSDCDNLSPDPKGCGIEFGECTDNCAPDDAQGVGMCLAFFGYAWDGQACVGQSGCSCVGSDCGSLPMNPVDCEKAHTECNADTVT